MHDDVAGGEPYPFDWSRLVPQVVHPLRVAIIEAVAWIHQPLSSRELTDVFEEEFGLSLVAYHVRVLVKAGVLVEASHRPVRGARETFYSFPADPE